MRKLFLSCLASSVLLAQAPAPSVLTDQRVYDLVTMGVSTREIMRIIAAAPKIDFDLRPESTQTMLKAGVSEEIIKAMAAKEIVQVGSVQADPVQTQPAPTTVSNLGSQSVLTASRSYVAAPAAATPNAIEVGVYFNQNGQWVEMMPEVVNWRTGGVMKSLATGGVVRGDINGRLRNGKSPTIVSGPTELLVYTPEGTQVTEYQLIKLRVHSNAREFRTVTGGVFHVSGDSNRDDLPFHGQHIAPRTWTIPVSGLKPGEYGLLPPGAIEARSASAQLGKMYTFTVLE